MKTLFWLITFTLLVNLGSSFGGEREKNVDEWWDELKKRGKGCVVLKINLQNRQRYYLVGGNNRRMSLSFALKRSMSYPSMKKLLADFDERIGKRILLVIGSEEIVADDVDVAEILTLSKEDLEMIQR